MALFKRRHNLEFLRKLQSLYGGFVNDGSAPWKSHLGRKPAYR